MCPPDETIEDPQPDTGPQPAPTFDDQPSAGNGEEAGFPIVPVAAGVGVVVLLAALAG